MSVTIAAASKDTVRRLVTNEPNTRLLDYCLSITHELWVGWSGHTPVCAWGLVYPTLLSSRAYLWMITIDEAQEHEFLLARHSQIVIRRLLEDYETIVGHCEASETRSIRWLKWLGATFGPSEGPFIPFTICRKSANA